MSKSFKAVNPPPTNLIKPNTSLTGRTEYLSWINGSLQMNLAKIEELCSGNGTGTNTFSSYHSLINRSVYTYILSLQVLCTASSCMCYSRVSCLFGSVCVYVCLLCAVVFTDSITLKRVRWNANVEHQYIDNFKVLQKCFSDLEVKKVSTAFPSD